MPQKPLLPYLGDDEHLRRVLIMIGYMAIVAGFAIAFVLLYPTFRWVFGMISPFIVALVIAYLFNPVVNFVQYRLQLSRIYGVILVNLIVLIVAAIFVAIIAPILITQARLATVEIRQFIQGRATPWITQQIGGSETPSATLAMQVSDSADEWIPDGGTLSVDELRTRILSLVDEEEAETPVGAETPLLPETMGEPEAPTDERFEQAEPRDEESVEPDRQDAEEIEERTGVTREQAEMLADAIRDWRRESNSEEVSREQLQGWLSSQSLVWRDAAGGRLLASQIEGWLNANEMSADRLIESALGSTELRSAAQSAAAGGAGVIGWLVSTLLASVIWLISSVFFLLFVILISFFLLIDFASLRGVIEVVSPAKWRARILDILEKMDASVGGFIRGQLTVALLVGVLTTIGMFVLGMKQYALLIGVIAGLGNLIPFFGPVIGGVPAVLYVLLADSYSEDRLLFLGLTIGLFVLIQTTESLFFQPYIVGQSARLHPVIVIMAVAIGAQFGVMGALLALPVTCIIRVLLKEFFWDKREEAWRKETGKRRLDEKPRRPRPPKKPKKF